MSDFDEWHDRHLAHGRPPAPFKIDDRVIVDSPSVDGGFSIHGTGVVTSVDYITDPNDPYGPWAVSVVFDDEDQPMLFNSRELRLETVWKLVQKLRKKHPRVRVDAETEEDFASTGEVPADAVVEEPSLLDRVDAIATPVYLKVLTERRQAAEFANDVESWLRARTEGGAR